MGIKVEKFVVTSAEGTTLENEVNLYLVEGEGDAILIDSGFFTEETYKLLKAITGKWDVKAAFITHLHEDHAGGIPFLKELGIRVFVHRNERLPPALKFDVDAMTYRVKEGLRLFFKGLTVKLVHTPGHTVGHISPYIEETGMLFSGDLILGRGTPWVGPPEGDMLMYLNTLKELLQLDISLIYPGHGPEITDPRKKIEEYIRHREEREKQILEAMEKGKKSLEEITEYVYARENLPEHVVPFARLTVLSHLEKLKKEGKIFPTSKNTYERIK